MHHPHGVRRSEEAAARACAVQSVLGGPLESSGDQIHGLDGWLAPVDAVGPLAATGDDGRAWIHGEWQYQEPSQTASGRGRGFRHQILTRRSTVETGSRPYNHGIKILLVCSANQCRSPMAEGLLRAKLQQAGVHAQVGSAGLLPGGSSATPDAVAVMAERGVDITRHVSCQITADIARSANLIIGMSRSHVREACVSYGALLQRAFTLKELVRRGEEIGPRRAEETLYTWLGRAGAGRRPSDLVGDSNFDDILDPIGRPRGFYEQTADELDDLLNRFLNLVLGNEHRAAGMALDAGGAASRR